MQRFFQSLALHLRKKLIIIKDQKQILFKNLKYFQASINKKSDHRIDDNIEL